MKRKWTLALLVVMILALSVCFFVACDNNDEGNDNKSNVIDDGSDYFLPIEEGCKQVTFYWNSGNIDISECDMWIWWDGKDGQGYLMYPCTYGAKVVVNVPDTVAKVGFIVRKNCSEPGGTSWGNATKDYDGDRYAFLTGESTVIYLKKGKSEQYTSSDGGKTLEEIKAFSVASMKDLHTIHYEINPATRITSLSDVKLYEGDKQIEIISLSSLGNNVNWGNAGVKEELDITKAYTLEISGFGQKTVVPIDVFNSDEFEEKYNYDGELGSEIVNNGVNFRVWAPTASKVVLNLFDDGSTGDARLTVDMQKQDKGLWFAFVDKANAKHGTYYTYSVTTALGTQEAVDPYAKSAGVNGNRGMVVDLDATDPDGWAEESYMNTISSYTDAVIWEVHVRDFSNNIASSRHKGQYLAFTETGLKNSSGVSVGVDYLVNLGVTHVQLMPVYDYATVDESNPNSGFNWGYDPKNYNVPEGSYSSDPTNGEVRVREFKQMVQGLHKAGLSVVMDVVYNHTYDANSSLNKIVPYYYYRYNSDGTNMSGSGCGNDTASERYMYRRFMIDSVTYWLTEYKLDGFRFDLMGLHDLETMSQIEKAVHEINPNAMIYGEGWTMGETTDGSQQANQTHIGKISATGEAVGSVAVFNDATRDGLKGSVFSDTGAGYINGNASANVNSIKFGYQGGGASGVGWRVNDAAVINYMSCHDNLSLWDKLVASRPDATKEELLAMNRLGATIVMTMQGTPFMQAGEEMLRTKDGDSNSYKSSDEVNNIKWEALTTDSDEYEMMLYYKALIELRKEYDVLRANGTSNVEFTSANGGALAVTIDDSVLILLNPTSTAQSFSVDGNWKIIGYGDRINIESNEMAPSAVEVAAYSAYILVK